ncbi:hypothetical protein COV88_03615 [Candidatus Saccharibacteria bacterium CG11_big_fil_rev_8_21_14_0_20_41_19]|nr:MAG: hypothetical protein AUK57_02110 [Candidatus Saccharibacteria bacterium CG2_30_41_52]PIQ70592.1 MAG: hypothetical protein COV88_03615 [Candidatus Saccharibacteria bacterium CG11_big_fil_rev_8_21_14_0_20_41_19]PIZ59633.1 MAG: hypothetical protein COY18_02900 [Candidatus Saccharibacteria bacterium CG_4_10_14_0_2_um_filter_41_11]PJC29771.1 MAG: hypothetical protein CO052_01550 [Candidatus Saccharibacteria bacterium CG_4_9_14_0_2_um_filter_41_9]PJE66377.1 MAG: hypothetical protein COU92_000
MLNFAGFNPAKEVRGRYSCRHLIGASKVLIFCKVKPCKTLAKINKNESRLTVVTKLLIVARSDLANRENVVEYVFWEGFDGVMKGG